MEFLMLTINREKNKLDECEIYRIFINHIEMGIIRNGEMKNFDLKNGSYKMQLKSSKWKSKVVEFSITSGSHLEFSCKPSWKNTVFSIFIHKFFKRNVGISLLLKHDIYI